MVFWARAQERERERELFLGRALRSLCNGVVGGAGSSQASNARILARRHHAFTGIALLFGMEIHHQEREEMPAQRSVKVGIVGGGIGGLALAVALKQRNIECVVFEKDDSFEARAQGYGLTLQQGAKTMRDLGIDDALAKKSIYSPSHFIFDHEGQVVAFWGPTRLHEADSRVKKKRKAKHNCQISRQALRKAILDECSDVIRWGKKVTLVEDKQDQAVIKFADGSEYVCDAAVGADGIFSRVRPCLENDSLRYLGLIVILGIFDSASFPLFKERIVQMTDGETRVFMMPFSKASETDPERAMWQLTFPVTESEARALSEGPPGTLRAEALKRCGNWHDPIPAVFASTDDALVTGYPVYDREPLDAGFNEKNSRITLLGDAAHPMSPLKGQGANQALLDALSLAQQLQWYLEPQTRPRPSRKKKKGKPSKPPPVYPKTVCEALRAFEHEMVPRSSPKVFSSRASCAHLHRPCMIEPSFHTARKNIPLLRSVERMRKAGIRPSDVRSGKLDEYAFAPIPIEERESASAGARPWDARRQETISEKAAIPATAAHASSSYKPTERLRPENGVYHVELVSFKEAWSRTTSENHDLHLCERMIVSKEADAGQVDALRAAINAQRYPLGGIEFCALSPSGFKGLLRNIPSENKKEMCTSTCAAIVSLTAPNVGERSRMLVLCGLKYRGNIASIVRSAVQSNKFYRIALVNVEREGDSGAATQPQASDEDIDYYSLYNAPLIGGVMNFKSPDLFLKSVPKSRPLVAVEISSNSVNMYSQRGLDALASANACIVMGAEDVGVPPKILERCKATIEMPSMSASVNVSCAFASVLSSICFADKGAVIAETDN